jgi:tetratricopeptide (TPR) repeat protein
MKKLFIIFFVLAMVGCATMTPQEIITKSAETLQSDQNNIDTLLDRGEALYSLGEKEEAMKDFKRASKLISAALRPLLSVNFDHLHHRGDLDEWSHKVKKASKQRDRCAKYYWE